MAEKIGELVIEIGADTAELKSKLAESENLMEGLGIAAKVALGVLTAAVVGAITVLTKLTEKSNEVLDSQSKLSYRLGATVTAIQALAYVSSLSGMSQDELSKAMERLNRSLAQAARTSTGEVYDALRRIGLSAQDLLKLDLDQRLALLAKRFEELHLSTAQQAETLRALGIRGQGLINVMADGGKEILNARKEIEAFNVATSNIDAKKIELANDALKRASLSATALGNSIALELAPAQKYLADAMADAGKQTQGYRDTVKSVVDTVMNVVGAMIDKITEIKMAWEEVKKSVGTVAAGFSAITEPVRKVIDTVAGYFKILKDNDSEAKKQLETPPNFTPFITKYREFVKEMQEEAEKLAKAQESAQKQPPPKLDRYSTEERKALNDKLIALKASIADEDAVLALHKQKQLLDMQDLVRKEILTKADANVLKLQAEDKYQKALRELTQSKIEEGFLEDDEKLKREYNKRLEAVAEFEANKSITTEKATQFRGKLEEAYNLKMIRLQASQYSNLANVVDTAMSSISAIVGDESQKGFTVMKAISMATSLVKGYEAVLGAYAAGNVVGGPIVGAIFAGIAAAGVAAQIAKLAGVGPKTGGSSVDTGGMDSGASQAAAATTAATTQAPQTPQTLHVTGLNKNSLFSGDMVRGLVKELVQYQRDGGTIVL